MPIRGAYCYNQLDFINTKDTMNKRRLFRVMEQAKANGLFSWESLGEPLLNKDVVEIVKKQMILIYTNLITSGVGPFKGVVQKLKDAGLRQYN